MKLYQFWVLSLEIEIWDWITTPKKQSKISCSFLFLPQTISNKSKYSVSVLKNQSVFVFLFVSEHLVKKQWIQIKKSFLIFKHYYHAVAEWWDLNHQHNQIWSIYVFLFVQFQIELCSYLDYGGYGFRWWYCTMEIALSNSAI